MAKFKPGESGNPSGRPKRGETMTDILRSLGEIEDVRHEGKMIARRVAVGHRVWQLALRGDVTAFKYIYDRLDGKPMQEIKVSGDAEIDAPILISFGNVKITSESADDGEADAALRDDSGTTETE